MELKYDTFVLMNGIVGTIPYITNLCSYYSVKHINRRWAKFHEEMDLSKHHVLVYKIKSANKVPGEKVHNGDVVFLEAYQRSPQDDPVKLGTVTHKKFIDEQVDLGSSYEGEHDYVIIEEDASPVFFTIQGKNSNTGDILSWGDHVRLQTTHDKYAMFVTIDNTCGNPMVIDKLSSDTSRNDTPYFSFWMYRGIVEPEVGEKSTKKKNDECYSGKWFLLILVIIIIVLFVLWYRRSKGKIDF